MASPRGWRKGNILLAPFLQCRGDPDLSGSFFRRLIAGVFFVRSFGMRFSAPARPVADSVTARFADPSGWRLTFLQG